MPEPVLGRGCSWWDEGGVTEELEFWAPLSRWKSAFPTQPELEVLVIQTTKTNQSQPMTSMSQFKLWQSNVYYCVASSLLTTVCKHLRIEWTRLWTFRREMMSHSCLTYDFRCSTVLGLLCCVLLLMMHQMFTVVQRFGPQADHEPKLFYYEAMQL